MKDFSKNIHLKYPKVISENTQLKSISGSFLRENHKYFFQEHSKIRHQFFKLFIWIYAWILCPFDFSQHPFHCLLKDFLPISSLTNYSKNKIPSSLLLDHCKSFKPQNIKSFLFPFRICFLFIKSLLCFLINPPRFFETLSNFFPITNHPSGNLFFRF